MHNRASDEWSSCSPTEEMLHPRGVFASRIKEHASRDDSAEQTPAFVEGLEEVDQLGLGQSDEMGGGVHAWLSNALVELLPNELVQRAAEVVTALASAHLRLGEFDEFRVGHEHDQLALSYGVCCPDLF